MIAGRIKEGYGIVQRDVMCMEGLSIYAKAVYALFISYAGQKDCCYPSIKTICKNLDISYPTVTKAIKELEEVKLLEVDRTLGESSVYYPNYIMKGEENETEEVEFTDKRSKQKKEAIKFAEHNKTSTYIGFDDYIDENNTKHIGFWSTYSKKVDKRKTIKAWRKIPPKIRALIMKKIPQYIAYQPDRQYRKSPYSYLLNECWGDEGLHKPVSNQHQQTPLKETTNRLNTKW